MKLRSLAHPHATQSQSETLLFFFFYKKILWGHRTEMIQPAHRQLFLQLLSLLWLKIRPNLGFILIQIQIPSLIFSAGWFHYKGSVTDLPVEANLSWSVWYLWVLCYSHDRMMFWYWIDLKCNLWRHDGGFYHSMFHRWGKKKKRENPHTWL